MRSLSEPEKLLLIVRRELYGGSLAELRRDLRARERGRPYIFKLSARLAEDLARLERLEAYERAHDVDLGRYVK